jgi:hypothetical protein
MMIRAKLKAVAGVAVVLLVLGGGVLAACVAGESKTAPPSSTPIAGKPTDAPQSRTVTSRYVMVAVSPDGKQLVGVSRHTGAVARLDGDAFSLDRIVVSDDVAAYHGNNGMYFGFSSTTGTWEKLALSNDVDAPPVVFEDMITIDANGHLYVFALATGKWSTIY